MRIRGHRDKIQLWSLGSWWIKGTDESRKSRKNIPVLGSVHTRPEKFENAAIFLQFGPLSTPIRRDNGAFKKRSSNRRNLKTPAFHFHVDGKHFENGAFQQR